MWKCPQQSQNVKSNFSLILFPSTNRPFMKKKDHTSASKSWGSFNFLLLSSSFYSLVYFKEGVALFNMKLDVIKFKLSILQFKAKGQEQRAGIFLLCQNNFSESITWKQLKDVALWCGVKEMLGKGTVRRKEGVEDGVILSTLCIYLWDVYDLNNF